MLQENTQPDSYKNSYYWNSQFQRCSTCIAKNCPYRNKSKVEGGDYVCRMEQAEFFHLRQIYSREYKLSKGDLAQLDLLLMSIIRLRRMMRYIAELSQEQDMAETIYKGDEKKRTAETFWFKQMRKYQEHMEKVERSVREWLTAMRFSRKSKEIKKTKTDVVQELAK